MGYLAPPLQMFRKDSMRGIVRGIWRKFNKRAVSNPLVRYNTGYHSFVRALLPTLGVAQLERAIVNILAEMEVIANSTADAIYHLDQEVKSLK